MREIRSYGSVGERGGNNPLYPERTEKHINSDHLPLYGEFIIDDDIERQKYIAGETDREEDQEINAMIDEGQSVESDNRQTT